MFDGNNSGNSFSGNLEDMGADFDVNLDNNMDVFGSPDFTNVTSTSEVGGFFDDVFK